MTSASPISMDYPSFILENNENQLKFKTEDE